MPVAASPAPRKSRRWRSSVPPVTRSAEHRPDSATAAVPWMSSLKRADLVAVLLQQAKGVVVGEILELHDDAGEGLAGGGHELVDQLVVGGAGEARLGAGRGRAGRRAAPGCWCRRRASPAGTAIGWMPAQAVYSESLPTGIPMPLEPRSPRPRMRSPSVTTIIATSRCGQLRRSSLHLAAVVGGDEDAARPLEDVAELLAREAHRRRVDDRHHLVRVLGDDAKEERLVAVVQRGHEDVLLEGSARAGGSCRGRGPPVRLAAHVRRQQALQTEGVALGLG